MGETPPKEPRQEYLNAPRVHKYNAPGRWRRDE